MRLFILRTLALLTPVLAATPILLSACSGADGADVPNDDTGSSSASSATTGCKKKVHLHIADYAYTDRLDDPNGAVKMNGCWDFDKVHDGSDTWGACKGASNKGSDIPDAGWVADWGEPGNWDDGKRMWVYDETAFSHSGAVPTDDARITDCLSQFSNHWKATPAKGYAYMEYQGVDAGWDPASLNNIQYNFAELYGLGQWWPFWSQWSKSKVGRPMAQIVNASQGGNAYTVTRGMCTPVTTDNYIGLYIPHALAPSIYDPIAKTMTYAKLTSDTKAWQGIVRAMNDCTTSGAVTAMACDMDMGASAQLNQGESWLSCNGEYELDMQTDGNLVVYQNGKATWGSGTQGTDSTYAVMQADGNFVVYGPSGPHWASNTGGHAGAYVVMQDDGNLVVYGGANHTKPLWASKSAAPPPPACSPDKTAGWSLSRGQNWTSCDGRFRLAMQTDGNLVIYEGSTALWGSGTQGSDSQYVTMQSDGNLVIYGSGAHWASNTGGHAGAYVAFQNDGNLVVYGGPNHTSPLWASNTGGH